jgi:CheY-like chemotaxis protein
VMLCDDNATHRALLEDVLAPLGFALLSAPDAESCLRLAAQGRPDLFLLDLNLPDRDGLSLAEELRAAGHAAPVILVSADAPAALKLHGASPFEAVLTKPLDLRRLREVIGTALGLRWKTEAPALVAAPSPAAPSPVALGPHAAELRRLAEIGFIRPLRERLDELAREEPALCPALAPLRALLDQFRLAELIAALDALHEDIA